MEQIGELVLDQLPAFFQPLQPLIKHVTNLFNTIKDSVMEFYYVSIV